MATNKSLKMKAPSTKPQAPENLQTSNSKDSACGQLNLKAWCFSGAWCLVLGAFFPVLGTFFTC
jgi:hypothetical protein